MELEQFYEFKLALGGIVFAVVAYGVLLSRKGVRLDFRELSLTPFPAPDPFPGPFPASEDGQISDVSWSETTDETENCESGIAHA